MIATIAVITEKKKSSAIAAIIAFIWKPLSSDRSDNDHWDRTFYISAIVVAAIATIAEKWFPYDRWTFFFHTDRSDHSDRNDHMETRLKLRIFTNKNTFQ